MSNFLVDKKVLLPCDFSDPSMAAIDEALGMVDETTQISVLHVLVPLNNVALEPGFIVEMANEESRREVAIEQLKERISDRHDRVSFAVRFGDPGTAIVDFAAEIKADMVIMPSHGRTGLNRLLLGSVAERVVRLAECPVLVLRHSKNK